MIRAFLFVATALSLASLTADWVLTLPSRLVFSESVSALATGALLLLLAAAARGRPEKRV
jgi:hypothetical protein